MLIKCQNRQCLGWTQGLEWSTCPGGLLLLLLLLNLLGAVCPGLIQAAQPDDQERQPHRRRAVLCEGGHQGREGGPCTVPIQG